MIKIAIIMLGADGTVLRTMPLAKALKKKHENSEIHWITRGDIKTLLETVSYIDQVHTVPFKTDDEFDFLYNFDISDEAMDLAGIIKAKEKKGYYNNSGYPQAFNFGAEYYLSTVFDDELKRKNKKTYQEMLFEAAEIPYNKEDHEIVLNENDKDYALDFIKKNGLENKKIVGIHMGSSAKWPSKAWDQAKIKELIIDLNEKGIAVILFGGPDEIEKHENFSENLQKSGVKIYRNNPRNTKKEFASLVSICNAIVCGDSFALHVAIALKKPVIALFFCTSPDEIEGYGLLRKIVSPKLYDFFPAKSDQYDKDLVNSISSKDVLSVLEEII